MDHCTYCKCKNTEQNLLLHGPVYDDPYSDVPNDEDFAYCEAYTNAYSHPTHGYFACCTECDREFWELSEIYVLDTDTPRNPTFDTACLRCIRQHNIANISRCKACGHIADGYFCWGFCRDCECGCIGLAVENCDNVQHGVKQP